jgi:UrcA family protein
MAHALAMFGVAVVLASTPGAHAAARGQNGAKTYSATLSIADLDLTRPEDVEKLERRVSKRARHFCRNFSSVTATPKMLRDCERRIFEENRPRIDRAVAAAGR